MPPAVVLDDVQALKELGGREVGVTEWLSLTQKRIEKFAEELEDRQSPCHIRENVIAI